MFDEKTYMKKYQKTHRKELREYHRLYLENNPWQKTYMRILSRCNHKGSGYYKNGIKNFLTPANLEYLWFRDKAYLLKIPSIDRINSKKNYTLENCRYMEKSENCCRECRKPVWQINGSYRKLWISGCEAARQTGIKQSNISAVARHLPHHKTMGGYKWEFAN